MVFSLFFGHGASSIPRVVVVLPLRRCRQILVCILCLVGLLTGSVLGLSALVNAIAWACVNTSRYALLLDTYIKDRQERDQLFNAYNNIPCVKQKGDVTEPSGGGPDGVWQTGQGDHVLCFAFSGVFFFSFFPLHHPAVVWCGELCCVWYSSILCSGGQIFLL